MIQLSPTSPKSASLSNTPGACPSLTSRISEQAPQTFGHTDKEFSQDTQKYWFYYEAKPYAKSEHFSAKAAALLFLQTLFSDIQMPEKVIVGEPVVRDGTWRQNFHRHMREVFSELGIAQ